MSLSEADFQRRIMDTARLFGWHRVHIRATEVQKGRWAVPYEGDSGLPDLVLARRGRLILAELKSDKGKVTPEQQAWIDAAGDNARVWRPADWDQILAELRAA